jgi:hypothetical protein
VPELATYKVPDEQCPSDYGVGLTVTTDSRGELGYLDKIVACTTVWGGGTYLKNDSDAVWTLRTRGAVVGMVRQLDRGDLEENSFLSAFPGLAMLVPGGVITSGLSPSSLAWDISLPLSVSWEGHKLVMDEVAALGQQAVRAALTPKSRLGAAVMKCTFTLDKYARSINTLADEGTKLSDIVLGGLGSGIATNKCREAVGAVRAAEGDSQAGKLSEGLDRLGQQTKVLERMESRLGYAQRGLRVLKLGIRFHGG